MSSLRTSMLGSVVLTLFLGTQTWASDGHGPGTAIITFPDDELRIYGSCIDWAFRTGEGVPNLMIEAAPARGTRVPLYKDGAKLSLSRAFWEIIELERFEPTEEGYVLAGTFKDLKSLRDPEPLTISVACG